jgi:hypothetical protein
MIELPVAVAAELFMIVVIAAEAAVTTATF